MGKVRALYRFLLFVVLTTGMLLGSTFERLILKRDTRKELKWRKRWMRVVPKNMGIRHRLHSPVPEHQGPAMFVCNHRSYLDPVIIGPYVEAVVVAKHEVSRWPLIGSAARAVGVLFVKREESTSRKVIVEGMGKALEEGYDILNYPEGTTSKRPHLLSFRPGGFVLAAEKGVPVIPVALDYEDADDAWIDDDTFLRHFFQMFSKKHIWADLAFGPVLTAGNSNELIQESRDWISGQLKEWESRRQSHSVS